MRMQLKPVVSCLLPSAPAGYTHLKAIFRTSLFGSVNCKNNFGSVQAEMEEGDIVGGEEAHSGEGDVCFLFKSVNRR